MKSRRGNEVPSDKAHNLRDYEISLNIARLVDYSSVLARTGTVRP